MTEFGNMFFTVKDFFSEEPKTGQEQYNDIRGFIERYTQYHAQNLELRDQVLLPIAKKLDISLSQLALAWIYGQAESLGIKIIPIPGTANMEHLKSNCDAVKIGLDPI